MYQTNVPRNHLPTPVTTEGAPMLCDPAPPRLSEFDQQVYDLAVKKKFRQSEIARIVGITQGAVSSRLSRMLKRLKFLETLDTFNLSRIDEELTGLLDPMEREILKNLALLPKDEKEESESQPKKEA